MRRLGWKFWLVLVLIISGMAAASLASGDDEDLTLLRAVIARVEAREVTPVERRTAVYGELIDGAAMPHYEVATEAARKAAAIWGGEVLSLISENPAVLHGATPAKANVPDPEIYAVRAIEALQLGAHSRSVTCTSLIVRESDWSSVVRHACLRLLAEGKDVAAVEVWLDALVMCTDGDTNTDSVEPFAAQWTDERLAALGPAARKRMSQGLAWLEARLERPIDWERVLYPNARIAIRSKLFSSKGWLEQLMAWDCGFSPERKAVQVVGAGLRCLKWLSPAAPKWSDRMRQFDQLEKALRDATGSIGSSQVLRYREIWRREALTHLRLLRAAVEIHDGGTASAIADPFSDGPITVLERDDAWKLSAGGSVLRAARTVKK